MAHNLNDLCPCGSNKPYRDCCLQASNDRHGGVLEEIKLIAAANPQLSIDELNIVLQHRVQARNARSLTDFCGLAPNQMANWLYSPIEQLDGVTVAVPHDLSGSPVMSYLQLILNEAMQNGGAFKSTSKGNLPIRLVRQASALLPSFAVSEHHYHISISEFAGATEDKFNALHYTRILAELGGILYRSKGQFRVKKAEQKRYERHGVQAFFIPMLKAATDRYNWAYMDGWEVGSDLRLIWLFMVWRLHSHGDVERLVGEVIRAFPALVPQTARGDDEASSELLSRIIESRFLGRFLEFWGFVVVNPRRIIEGAIQAPQVKVLPLMSQVFQFQIASNATLKS
jgi:hypothetical protein